MEIQRKAYHDLLIWKESKSRKPLIIRGARQVGKSTLVSQFGAEYKHFVSLNLEKPADRAYFTSFDNVKQVIEAILFDRNINAHFHEILLFIDEIQQEPKAIALLRYFYEELPKLHVISAGSLLEFVWGEVSSFPVGRVVQYVLHPLSFEEFLKALGEDMALRALQTIPLKEVAYKKLFALYHIYLIIGGMPEIVQSYIENGKSMVGLQQVYSGIWDNYKNDIVKYAKNRTEENIINLITETAPSIRDRISYVGFGSSNYKSKDVKEAFFALDKARLIQILYPSTSISIPITTVYNRKPKIQFLDTGILNYANRIQGEMIGVQDFNSIYKGYFINHMIIQEVISMSNQPIAKPHFWVRENSNANAEVDLVYRYKNMVVPIEIKSGAKGRLRSLHEFVDRSDHDLAIRLLANKLNIEKSTTRNGKEFTLVNLPYFCMSQMDKYLDWILQKNKD